MGSYCTCGQQDLTRQPTALAGVETNKPRGKGLKLEYRLITLSCEAYGSVAANDQLTGLETKHLILASKLKCLEADWIDCNFTTLTMGDIVIKNNVMLSHAGVQTGATLTLTEQWAEESHERQEYYKLWVTAVRKGHSVLGKLPEEHRTKALCLAAVEASGFALRYVPAELRTAEMCHLALGKHGFGFQNVPESMKTRELCLSQVAKHRSNLQYVP